MVVDPTPNNYEFTSTEQLARFPVSGMGSLLLSASLNPVKELLVAAEVCAPLLCVYCVMLAVEVALRHKSWVDGYSYVLTIWRLRIKAIEESLGAMSCTLVCQ